MAAVGSRFTRTGVENYTLPLNVRVRNSTAKEIEVIYLRTTSHTSGDHCYEIRFGGTPLLSAGFIRETNIAQSSVSPKGSASKRTHTPPPFTFIGSTSFSFSSVKGNEQLIKLVETGDYSHA
ncbi:MAG: hypothetical protein JSS62_07330 [Verrucomicrobia bacterium]|nr:hypothetical protein [Verrucomicrobiota bacterium]MBS0646952.1 hypothetical protein [Verrucomicrobiota bacterium]